MPVPTALSLRGGKTLSGTVDIQGAKNSALPIICLAGSLGLKVIMTNAPRISDISILMEILQAKGCLWLWDEDLVLDTSNMVDGIIDDERFRQIRMALPLAIGLAVRFGRSRTPVPQGDPIGERPLTNISMVCRAFGLDLKINEGWLEIDAGQARAADCQLPWPTHTASHAAIILATMIPGRSKLQRLSIDPEVQIIFSALSDLSVPCEGRGQCMEINGGAWNQNLRHHVMPDRVELATLCCAVQASGGRAVFRHAWYEQFDQEKHYLEAFGCKFERQDDSVSLNSQPLCPMDVRAGLFPEMFVDWVPMVTAVLLRASGRSRIDDIMYTERTHHLSVLREMGADLQWHGHAIEIHGVPVLGPTNARVPDIRGLAAVIIAALTVDGQSTLHDLSPLYRGYADLPGKLASLGADINLIFR